MAAMMDTKMSVEEAKGQDTAADGADEGAFPDPGACVHLRHMNFGFLGRRVSWSHTFWFSRRAELPTRRAVPAPVFCRIFPAPTPPRLANDNANNSIPDTRDAAPPISALSCISQILHDVSLKIKPGSRVLMVGANGAGKTTLLRVISGKHFAPFDTLSTLGTHAPQDQCNGLSYLGERWCYTVAFAGSGVAYASDIPVHQMSAKIQEKYKERRDKLVELLDIDMNWRMHQVSDGQRRRVQIMLGLLRPFKLLLMDEVTVDLDVVARQDLLAFLREECEQRQATVIFATHIYDGLDDWPSHLMRVSDGLATPVMDYDKIPELNANIASGAKAPLHKTVLDWLREERRQGKNMSQPTAEEKARAKHILGPQGGWASGRLGGTPSDPIGRPTDTMDEAAFAGAAQ